ncbi:hypothetical protein KDA_27180 [Dictyobacter alpinus]|uniref:Transglycosylase SLT domain-containing protein n=1 Tax=Dictyobacter alpinus TaxID=2014873 RepID=A0A402B7A0_9CHLR|nr:lytic transglycosylase domain-containing protein [Dictyobacter alpinus]GCE27234.1 hypothetical protein KDA_27180 [Dictyobacter alpinus]
MPQFQPTRTLKKNPPADSRASTLRGKPDTDAHVMHKMAAEPETLPMPVPDGARSRGSSFGQNAGRAIPEPNTPPLGFKRMPVAEVQRNLPAVRTTRQLNPISISIPLSYTPLPPTRDQSLVVRQGKAPLVIPGTRKKTRQLDTDELDFHGGHHLTKRLRHGLVILATLCTFLMMMFSLTPIGQNHGAGVSGLFQWTSVSQKDIDILARRSSGSSTVDGFNEPMSGTKAMYVALARQDAMKYGISPDLYERQIQQESHFDPNAYSYVGAIGIAQFMPGTAADMHIDPHDPIASLDAGARFMGNLNNYFHGDYAKALAGYNAGPGAVDVAVSNCGGAWLSCMDPQAQAYVYIIEG